MGLFLWNIGSEYSLFPVMELTEAQYREFADECRRLAALAKTADERKVLQEMETRWTQLAEEAEGRSSKLLT